MRRRLAGAVVASPFFPSLITPPTVRNLRKPWGKAFVDIRCSSLATLLLILRSLPIQSLQFSLALLLLHRPWSCACPHCAAIFFSSPSNFAFTRFGLPLARLKTRPSFVHVKSSLSQRRPPIIYSKQRLGAFFDLRSVRYRCRCTVKIRTGISFAALVSKRRISYSPSGWCIFWRLSRLPRNPFSQNRDLPTPTQSFIGASNYP